VALREIGRIERPLFTLSWLQDPELRRRVTAGLNKGEAHHTLKRAIYKRGSVSDRTQLDQDLNAMALNLVVAAITLWNTAYLDRALSALEEARIPVPSEYLPHISPLGWEHITLTGTYTGKDDRLRGAGSDLSAQTSSSATGQWELSVVFLPIGPVWPTRTPIPAKGRSGATDL
jgi:hypothetical protein